MHSTTFSSYLQQAMRPNNPCYHPIQGALFGSLSYIGTAVFTKVPPIRGAMLATVAYAVSQATAPLFVQCFEPLRDLSLFPLIGQAMQLTFSFASAKMICNIAGYNLSFKEARQVGGVFFATLFTARFALHQFGSKKKSAQ